MMRRTALAGLALSALTACSGAGQPEIAGEPEVAEGAVTETALPSDLSAMLVIRATRRLQQGDTVYVDLGRTGDGGQVEYWRRDGRSGSISLEHLGPADEGRMVVAREELNVRRCRSTGCSVAGFLVRGQVVDVRDFAGRWYRVVIDGEAAGYVLAEDLHLPLVSQIEFLQGVAAKTGAYYDENLKDLKAGSDPVFSGYDLKFDDEVLDFEFYTGFTSGPALVTLCTAMRGIADFVRGTMAATPTQLFPAYSVGVYFIPPDAPVADHLMVAGLTGEDGVYCMVPD
jgi:hypothetical protein